PSTSPLDLPPVPYTTLFRSQRRLAHVTDQHGGHGVAFEDGFARELAVIVGARGLGPGFDLEMLIFEGMGQLVGHDHALVIDGNPDRKSTRLNSSHGSISYAV